MKRKTNPMKTQLLMVLFAAGLIFSACKKYEEGPMFSLRTKKARVTGEWKIDKVTLNGNDITNDYKNAAGSDYVLHIEKDEKYHTTGTNPDDGTWELGEDGDDIYFKSSKAGSIEQGARILRLKNTELWLRFTAPNTDKTVIQYVQ